MIYDPAGTLEPHWLDNFGNPVARGGRDARGSVASEILS